MNIRKIPAHPPLFAAFFVLFLYSNNFFIVPFSDAVLPLLGSAIIALLAWYLIRAAIRNGAKAAMITSVMVVLFFLYGHLSYFAGGVNLLGYDLRRDSHFVIPFVVVFAAAVFAVLRTKNRLDGATKIANAVAGAMVAATVINIGILGAGSLEYDEPASEIQVHTGDAIGYPDVYYIVPDSYASSDILRDVFDYDNSEFVDYLEDKGFVVQHGAHSNYARTIQSITSTLEMEYIHEGLPGPDSTESPVHIMNNIIRYNEVMNVFKENGYAITSFDSGVSLIRQITSADWTPCHNNISEFLGVLIRTSMLDPIHVYLLEFDHRNGIICTFDLLPEIAKRDGRPDFVFAHMLIPHQPYIFGIDGERVDVESLSLTGGWDSFVGYTDQLTYTNKRLTEVIERIIADDPASVIIIQSDHGPRHDTYATNHDDADIRQLFGIFSAYYMPGGQGTVPESLASVNIFRVVFDRYLGIDYELLDDRSFYYHKDHQRNLREVTHILE